MGGDWITALPDGWCLKQIRHIFRIHNGATPKSGDSEYWNGDINWITPEDLGNNDGKDIVESRRKITSEGYANSGVSLAPAGSIALSTRAPIGHLAKTLIPSCVNQGCRLLEPNEGCSEYWYYASLAAKPILVSRGQGTTFMELPRQSLASVKLPVPPDEEQPTIARFLDFKTAQIDALIAKKKMLLDKLAEKRTALISHAVTKGLDSSVAMKDSGVVWLGNVPAHWKVIPIKFSLDMPITDGPHSTPQFYDDGIPFISAEAVKNDRLDFSRKRGYISENDHAIFSKKYKPKYGDVYMVKSGATTGAVARVETYEEFNIWSPLAVLRPHAEKSITDFLFYVLKSKPFFYSVELSWSYGTQQNIGMGVISNIRMALPPVEEQQEICRYLGPLLQNIEDQRAKIDNVVERLHEYRSALITNAVTGKIDVREFQIPQSTVQETT